MHLLDKEWSHLSSKRPLPSENTEETLGLLQKIATAKVVKTHGVKGIGLLKSSVKQTSYKRWEGQSIFAMRMSSLKKQNLQQQVLRCKNLKLL